MTELSLRDVRCFAGKQSGRLARITLLVGPNSAGKSTFLGCYKTLALLANLHDLDDKNHFDQMPFCMGGFDTIARSGCSAFSIEGTLTNHCHNNIRFDFKRATGGECQEQHVHLGWQNNYIDISLQTDQPESFLFRTPRFSFLLNRAYISYTQISTWLSRSVMYGHLPFNGNAKLFRKQGGLSVTEDEVVNFAKFLSFFHSEFPLQAEPALNIFAIDPSLERRQRIYQNIPRPLGREDLETVPFLSDLGERLGLWKDIQIHEEKQGFSIMVHTAAGVYNLQDVGYGVHGMLPLAQALYKQPPDAVLLLQHPEVHLHPEAQANLAQFMVESQQGFVIETHSDHFSDRFQICVMRGQLLPEDISILYFEPSSGGSKTVIHSITLDGNGNLSDPPRGFREFFNREVNALLGFEE